MVLYFKKNKETKTKKYWACQTIGCDAYVHTSIHDVVLKITGEHNHLPHPENVVLKSFRTKGKTTCYERNNSNNRDL